LEMTSSCRDGHGRTDYGGVGREESFAVVTTTPTSRQASACVRGEDDGGRVARARRGRHSRPHESARPVVGHRERVRPRATHLLVHGAV
jgi:hypothetical protein